MLLSLYLERITIDGDFFPLIFLSICFINFNSTLHLVARSSTTIYFITLPTKSVAPTRWCEKIKQLGDSSHLLNYRPNQADLSFKIIILTHHQRRGIWKCKVERYGSTYKMMWHKTVHTVAAWKLWKMSKEIMKTTRLIMCLACVRCVPFIMMCSYTSVITKVSNKKNVAYSGKSLSCKHPTLLHDKHRNKGGDWCFVNTIDGLCLLFFGGTVTDWRHQLV